LVLLPFFFLLLGGPQDGSAYSLNGYRWPAGSQISMHLQLSRPLVAFQDGSSSWNASAADALAIWNQYLDTVTFVQAARFTISTRTKGAWLTLLLSRFLSETRLKVIEAIPLRSA
jgi:hypothetical protein